MSVLWSISSFVLYNGKGIELERDLEIMNFPVNLWSKHERSSSLMWLMRDVDKEAENLPSDTLIKNLFSDQV